MSAPNKVELQVIKATAEAGKTYSFDEAHDHTRPGDWWFQESSEGLILFIVFYTQACRWSLCTACNLPSVGSQRHVEWRDIIAQIDWMLAQPEVVARRPEIRKVIVSNNGSVLDEHTFSSTALIYLIAQMNLTLPNVAVLTLETRVEYVDLHELEFLQRVVNEGDTPTVIELAVGFETFDDHLRNKVFGKGLSLDGFEALVQRIADPAFRLKCYFMQKPVAEMTDEQAVADVKNGIDYLHEIAQRYGVTINMHLNPTYVARGTPLESTFRAGNYQPPLLADVARATLHGLGKQLSIYVGLNDEGLAVEGGSFLRDGDDALVAELEAFNRSGDYEQLARYCSAL